MKFTRELPTAAHVIRAYSTTEVRVGERMLTRSFLVSANTLIDDWAPRTVADLKPEHFAPAFNWAPEIILLGTGSTQLFPARAVQAAILSRGIGFEAMNTGAACRTFNVLISEDRRVALAVIL